MGLVSIAVAPVLIILFYIYLRDKYEKEPLLIMALAVLAGCIIIIPVIYAERFISMGSMAFPGYWNAAYTAFLEAALTEEVFKFLAFMLLIWGNRNFNEKFDGIVYAVFISLGFALVENLLYVFNQGFSVGVMRAGTAVPAHALFGVVMGYQLGLAKLYPKERLWRLMLALIWPIMLHGIYDFILMSGHELYILLFIPYLVFLWIFGFRRMKDLSDRSIFRGHLKN